MKPARILLLGCSVAVMIAGCRQDESPGPPGPAGGHGTYVVNEGLLAGGGSLSFYSEDLDTMENAVVGGGLGWVFPNDMLIVGTRGYVVINGLDEVDVIDLTSDQRLRSIPLPPSSSPEYIAGNASAIYVANAGGSVSMIRNDSVVKTGPRVVAFPGGILMTGGRLLVSDFGAYENGMLKPGHLLVSLDTDSLTPADSQRIGSSLSGLTAVSGNVFVVSTGNSTVYELRVSNLAPVDSIALGPYLSGDIGTDGSSLFVLNADSVAKLSVGPLRVARSAFIARHGGNFFYAMAVNPLNAEVVVSNIAGASTGRIEIYTPSGSLRRAPMTAGNYPGAFAFR